MITLQFYTRSSCTLCHSALAVVERVRKRFPFDLEIIDIDTDPALQARYDSVIPVVTRGSEELAREFIDEKILLDTLRKEVIF